MVTDYFLFIWYLQRINQEAQKKGTGEKGKNVLRLQKGEDSQVTEIILIQFFQKKRIELFFFLISFLTWE